MFEVRNKYSSETDAQAIRLFYLIGRSIWAIQHLEDALSHSIAIKNPKATNRAMGNKILESHRRLPLGRAVERAEIEGTFDDAFLKKLQDFVGDRNWLVHKCMRESVDERGGVLDQEKLFSRVQGIGMMALSIKEEIEADMVKFCSAKKVANI